MGEDTLKRITESVLGKEYTMELYMLVMNGAEWEDLILYISEEEAMEASKKYPNARVEIFAKSEKGGQHPTYSFYRNGTLISNS